MQLGTDIACYTWSNVITVEGALQPVFASPEQTLFCLQICSTFHSSTYSYWSPIGFVRSPVGMPKSNRSPVRILESYWSSTIFKSNWILKKIQVITYRLTNINYIVPGCHRCHCCWHVVLGHHWRWCAVVCSVRRLWGGVHHVGAGAGPSSLLVGGGGGPCSLFVWGHGRPCSPLVGGHDGPCSSFIGGHRHS